LALSLRVEGVEAGYGAVRALHGVSLTVDSGKTVALLGTNGNGKSTLMKCVMGMVRPTKGSILLSGHDLTKLSTEEIVNLGVTMVPEGRRLFPKLTVEENRCSARSGRWRAARSRRTGSSATRPSRSSRSGAGSSPARCPAGSNRCSPSPAP
jgi:ABC-type branched-subunit amino acid transport system ATPase component